MNLILLMKDWKEVFIVAKEMNKQLRAKCEKLIYDTLDALDPSKTNSEHINKYLLKCLMKNLRNLFQKIYHIDSM